MILRGAAAFDRGFEADPDRCAKGEDRQKIFKRRNRGLFLAAFIDSFLVYITELLIEILSKHPYVAYSRSVEGRLAWEFESIKDLRWHVIEAAVQEMSFKSFDSLDNYLQKKVGLHLSTGNLNKLRLAYLMECRNSIVHNRGLFSSTSDARLKARGRLVDDFAPKFSVEFAIGYLIECADSLDKRAAQKFDLNLSDFNEHMKEVREKSTVIDRYLNEGKRKGWKFEA